MGVPQRRERIFFIGLRNDISAQFLKQIDMFTSLPFINLNFKEKKIPFIEFADYKGGNISEYAKIA